MQKKTKAPKPTPAMISAAMAVFQAMALVQTVEPIVKGYQRKILDHFKFKVADKWVDQGMEPEIITDPKDSYLMSEDDFKIYHAECYKEGEAAGLHVEDPDFCPLLVADYALTKAQWALCDAIEPLTKVSQNQVLCSGLDNYKKYVDLSLKYIGPFCQK